MAVLGPLSSAHEQDEQLFTETELLAAAVNVLAAMGAPLSTAELVARSFVLSNLVGHDSHGIVRVLQYWDWVKSGQIIPGAQPTVAVSRGAVATVDGAWGFGQPAAQMATGLAIELAQANGVGAVAISKCNHIGRLGEYVATIAGSRQWGLAFANSGPVVAPFGGSGRVMGTNPFAWSAPTPHGPVVLDFATSKVAEGKLKIALAKGLLAPPGALVDAQGKPSTDPAAFYSGGALLPFGEHKGSGLSMLIELTAGLASGMGTSCDPGYLGGNGTLLLVVDIAAFVDPEKYLAQAGTFYQQAKAMGAGPDGADVLMPGELEARTLEARRRGGLGVPAEIRRQMTALADDLGADLGPLTWP